MYEKAYTSRELFCLQQFAKGDGAAITNLYKAFHKDLYIHSFHLTGCREVSEDIVQEVFIKLWINRGKLDEIEDLKAYLFRMGQNLTISYIRNQKRRREISQDYASHQDEAITSNNILEEKEINKVVREGITHLPKQQQAVFVLKRIYGLKNSHLSKILHISESTVKNTMKNSVSKLKQHIEDKYQGIEKVAI